MDNGEAEGLISLPLVSDNCPVHTRAAGVKQCRCVCSVCVRVCVCVCVCVCVRVSAKKIFKKSDIHI